MPPIAEFNRGPGEYTCPSDKTHFQLATADLCCAPTPVDGGSASYGLEGLVPACEFSLSGNGGAVERGGLTLP